MRKLQLLMISILLVSATGKSILASEQVPELATEASQPVAADNKVKDGKETPRSARLFIGHISAALLAADYDKVDAAISHLGYAKQNIQDLKKEVPDFKTIDRLRVGKLYYITKQQKYALFPFEDGDFAVQIPELGRKTEKKLGIIPRDARVVFMHMEWNLPKIQTDIEEVILVLSHRDSVQAAKLLQKIISGDITETEEKYESTDALQPVYDHLMLANNLLRAADYTYARFAVYHAQGGLKQYVTSQAVGYDEQTRALQNEMQTVMEELKEGDPSLTEKMKQKMSHWTDTIKGLIHTQKKPE